MRQKCGSTLEHVTAKPSHPYLPLHALYAILAPRRLAAGALSAVDSLVEAHFGGNLPPFVYLEGKK